MNFWMVYGNGVQNWIRKNWTEWASHWRAFQFLFCFVSIKFVQINTVRTEKILSAILIMGYMYSGPDLSGRSWEIWERRNRRRRSRKRVTDQIPDNQESSVSANHGNYHCSCVCRSACGCCNRILYIKSYSIIFHLLCSTSACVKLKWSSIIYPLLISQKKEEYVINILPGKNI